MVNRIVFNDDNNRAIGVEVIRKKNNDNKDVVVFVPIAEGNRHYDEIKRQVDAGTLTIAAAA